MPETKVKVTWDPCQSYFVRSPNPLYSGVSYKCEFLNGRGFLGALPQDDPQEFKDFRVQQLEWFINSGYQVEPTDRPADPSVPRPNLTGSV